MYTERMRLIDDVNEICEVLQESRNLYTTHHVIPGDATEEQERVRNLEILQRVSSRAIDRQYLNLNQIYEEAQIRESPSQVLRREELRVENRKRLILSFCDEQDYLPVSQTFIFNICQNHAQKSNLAAIKAHLNYVDQSRVLTGAHEAAELRLC